MVYLHKGGLGGREDRGEDLLMTRRGIKGLIGGTDASYAGMTSRRKVVLSSTEPTQMP